MALPQFWFSFWSLFTGQLLYFDLCFTMFNALFTTLPILALAMNDDAGSSDTTLERRRAGHYLYRLGSDDTRFTAGTFAGWVLLGIWQSGVVFAVAFLSLDSVLPASGHTTGMWVQGTAAYTYLILTCSLQIAVITNRWNTKAVAAIAISLFSYAVFIAILCSTGFSGAFFELWVQSDAYGIIQILAAAPAFWFGCLLAPVMAVGPYWSWQWGRRALWPDLAYLIALRERDEARAEELSRSAAAK